MKRFILTLLVLLSPSLSFAQGSLGLDPAQASVAAGSRFEIAVDAAFPANVLGGEFRVEYDPSVVHLEGFEWNPAYGDDPLLRCRPEIATIGSRGCEAGPGFVSIGQLGGLPSGEIGRLQFVAVGAGISDIQLEPVSPFSDLDGVAAPMSLETGAVQVVPEPGLTTGLLLGSLVLALARRKTGGA